MQDGTDHDPHADAARIEALFTRSDGRYRVARWARPQVVACFGLEDDAAQIMTDAVQAVATLSGAGTAAEDAELGVNTMIFACTDWAELRAAPGLDRLIPDIARLTAVLAASGANQYRIFGFEPDDAGRPGAIRLSITLLRWDDDLARMSWRAVALAQAVHAALLWSDHAFTRASPVAEIEGTGRAVVVPFVQDVVRAAYHPDLPDAATDPAHAGLIVAHLGDAGSGA
ncbi:MAG: hypothetical protein AAF899_15965 [Pseudomonadota bacterium]